MKFILDLIFYIKNYQTIRQYSRELKHFSISSKDQLEKLQSIYKY